MDNPVAKVHAADRRVRELTKSLLRGDPNVTDENLIQAVEEFAEAYYSSAYGVAYQMFRIITPICLHRPHLTDRLLEFPAWGLFGMFDHGEQAVAWIRWQLARPGDEPFAAGPEGIAWLSSLAQQPERFQAMFDRFRDELSRAEGERGE